MPQTEKGGPDPVGDVPGDNPHRAPYLVRGKFFFRQEVSGTERNGLSHLSPPRKKANALAPIMSTATLDASITVRTKPRRSTKSSRRSRFLWRIRTKSVRLKATGRRKNSNRDLLYTKNRIPFIRISRTIALNGIFTHMLFYFFGILRFFLFPTWILQAKSDPSITPTVHSSIACAQYKPFPACKLCPRFLSPFSQPPL